MDHAAVLALFDRELREGARPEGPGARVERIGPVVRQTAPRHGWNGVVWSGLGGAAETGNGTRAARTRAGRMRTG